MTLPLSVTELDLLTQKQEESFQAHLKKCPVCSKAEPTMPLYDKDDKPEGLCSTGSRLANLLMQTEKDYEAARDGEEAKGVPFILLQEDEYEGSADCGCNIFHIEGCPALNLCPLHEAAPDLLKLIIQTKELLEKMHNKDGSWSDCPASYKAVLLTALTKGITTAQGGK